MQRATSAASSRSGSPASSRTESRIQPCLQVTHVAAGAVGAVHRQPLLLGGARGAAAGGPRRPAHPPPRDDVGGGAGATARGTAEFLGNHTPTLPSRRRRGKQAKGRAQDAPG